MHLMYGMTITDKLCMLTLRSVHLFSGDLYFSEAKSTKSRFSLSFLFFLSFFGYVLVQLALVSEIVFS